MENLNTQNSSDNSVGAEVLPSQSDQAAAHETLTSTKNFYDLSLPEIESYLVGLGKQKFRAQQVFKWVYEKRVTDFDQMTNISQSFREELPGLFHFELPKSVQELKREVTC